MNKNQTAISIQSVGKKFGDFTAIKEVSFDIANGEFFTLLGPSGCGKTTLLRLIGGFEATTEGKIFLYDEEIENLPANKRPVNTVFQQYALFPHMTVTDNIKFGMKMLGMSMDEQTQRAEEMLRLVHLEEFAHRKPSELSGGQQQRVALARALAPRPKVLLLDEPLSALDLKLRQAMRFELKRIQKKTGITFVFVTHDQEEALTMSDRIAVMSAGNVQQIGSAREIYEEPENSFVADFIGETNLVDVTITSIDNNKAMCTLSDNSVLPSPRSTGAKQGQKAKLSIRPERVHISHQNEGAKADLVAKVDQVIYMGTDTVYVVCLEDGTEISARIQNALESNGGFKVGEKVNVSIDHDATRLLVG